MSYFFRGVLMGLIFGVPAGAIGVLTVRNSLKGGFFAGFFTGLGSSAADLLYAIVSVFGIGLISRFLLNGQFWFGLIGGAFIVLMGILSIRRKSTAEEPKASGAGIGGKFLTSFFIALMNPATILSFLAAFAAFNITGKLSLREGIFLILGILLGTCFWWAGLSGIVSIFRGRVTDKINRILNFVLGCLLIILGSIVLVRTVWDSFR